MYQLIQADENTWAYQNVMPDGDTVRFFVLNGEEKCLVIDSGFMPIDIRALAAEALQQAGKLSRPDGTEKPILLANTHGDMDHVGGNGSFDSFYITTIDYDNLDLKNRFPGIPYIPAEEGTTIELGGRTLRYVMAPGHTYGNAILLDVTNRILFPGDMVQTGTMFMFGPHRSPDQLAGSLEKLKNMKDQFDQIYACHGQMILPPDAVDQTIAAWNQVLNHSITPVPKNVLDTDIDMYCCGFCNFYCNKEQ